MRNRDYGDEEPSSDGLRVCEVTPVDDDREHDMSEACWCRPRLERRSPTTGRLYPDGGVVVIHRDATQRAAEAS